MDAIPPDGPPPMPNPFDPPHAAGDEPRRHACRPLSILGTFVGAVAVLVASVIAFVVTCVPIGYVAFSQQIHGQGNPGGVFALALIVGAAAGLLIGFVAFRLIFRSIGRRMPPASGE